MSNFTVFLADAASQPTTSSNVMMLGSLVLIVVVFYFFVIRPESKRKKEAQKMLNELIVGNDVVTIGGVVGKVVSIKDDTITIETGNDRTRIVFKKDAIREVASKDE